MADKKEVNSNSGLPQWQRAGLLFAGVTALLGAGYFLMLRNDFSVLLTDLHPEDAAGIVAGLEEKGVRFKLAEQGSTILVPRHEADAVRLAIAGSEAPSRATVGFELFNDSEMGLTDFAQKIKYQRALQGELSRSILMMDGVENARVHVAVPERSMFRGNAIRPTAAVTLIARENVVLGRSTIEGVRDLVAASVPELRPEDVVILDGEGQIILGEIDKSAPDAQTVLASPPAAPYQKQIEDILGAMLAEENFEVFFTNVPAEAGAETGGAATSPKPAARLKLAILTDRPLGSEAEAALMKAVRAVVPDDVITEQDLSFLARADTARRSANELRLASVLPVTPSRSARSAMKLSDMPMSFVLPGAGALALLLGALVLMRRSGPKTLSEKEHRAFADLLNNEVRSTKEAS